MLVRQHLPKISELEKVRTKIGWVVVQASAIIFHLSRNEARVVLGNIVLLLLAVLIVVGRVAIVPMTHSGIVTRSHLR